MSALLLEAWVWLALGGALATLEILAPGYVLLGFGLSAFAMAGVVGFGGAALAGTPRLELWLLVLWAALALAAWWGLMLGFGRPSRGRQRREGDINDFDNSL